MTGKTDRVRAATGDLIGEVRARIWAWDPVRLVSLGVPKDEYDCLISPVTGGLREGLPANALAESLHRHVVGHFGIEPTGTDAFASDLVDWYRQRGGNEVYP